MLELNRTDLFIRFAFAAVPIALVAVARGWAIDAILAVLALVFWATQVSLELSELIKRSEENQRQLDEVREELAELERTDAR